MALKAVTYCLFFQPLYLLNLFSLFLSLTHVQEWEECSWFFNVKCFSYFPSSALSASNTNDAWYFEVKGSPSIVLELTFWPKHCQDWQALDCIFIVSCVWCCSNKVGFSKEPHTHKLCGGLCRYRKINQTYRCTRIWKVLVRLRMKHSENVLCSNNLILDTTHW
jgi:hypothetical protein